MITLEKNGRRVNAQTGFSWKLLFFGCLYPAFKGDFKGFIIQLILCTITFGISWLISPFFYNKNFINRMISKGWRVTKN